MKVHFGLSSGSASSSYLSCVVTRLPVHFYSDLPVIFRVSGERILVIRPPRHICRCLDAFFLNFSRSSQFLLSVRLSEERPYPSFGLKGSYVRRNPSALRLSFPEFPFFLMPALWNCLRFSTPPTSLRFFLASFLFVTNAPLVLRSDDAGPLGKSLSKLQNKIFSRSVTLDFYSSFFVFRALPHRRGVCSRPPVLGTLEIVNRRERQRLRSAPPWSSQRPTIAFFFLIGFSNSIISICISSSLVSARFLAIVSDLTPSPFGL